MGNKIETTNIFGETITCTSNQWYGHVVLGHEIMRANKDAVVDTIKSPEYVYESNDDNNRDVYFKRSKLATYSAELYTKVVIDNDNKEVVTAFPTKSVKGGISDVKYPDGI